MSIKTLKNVKPEMNSYASGYANYDSLMLKIINPYYEIAVLGKDAHNKTMVLNKKYNANTLFIGSFGENDLEILQGKYLEGTTMIYVC